MPNEAKEFYENMELLDKENLKPLEVILGKIFKKQYEIKYITTPNYRIYLNLILKRNMSSIEKGLLTAKILPNKYYFTYQYENETTLIKIYNKNIIS